MQSAARQVDDERITSVTAYREGSTPTKLVVFCHGYGQTVEGAWLKHLRRTASDDIVAVSTNYRDNLGFPSQRGAEDTIALTRATLARFPSIKTVYALGVSMGGNVCGNAVTLSARQSPVGKSLYDFWVDVEGLTNLSESWTEGRAALPDAAAGMERDAGGMRAVAVIHGFNDGLVPYNQAREMALALQQAGIPTQLFNVVFDSPTQDSGTTLTGDLGLVTGGQAPDANDAAGLNLTGHGWEGDYDHPVIRAGFDQLARMLDGRFPTDPYGENVINPTPVAP